MKVLLTQTIERTGIVGEVIEVSNGFARNYLLPKGLAIQPTDGNIKRPRKPPVRNMTKQLQIRAGKEARRNPPGRRSHPRHQRDEGHLFGSVSKRDIAEELVKLGHNVEADDVRLEEPLRRIDTYTVAVHPPPTSRPTSGSGSSVTERRKPPKPPKAKPKAEQNRKATEEEAAQ